MDKVAHKLFEAVKLGQMSILEETLRVSGFIKDAVDDYGMSALHHAVLTQNIECISLLIDLQCPLDIQDKQGRTALFIACLNLVPIDIVRLLLYNPQNFVNLCDKSGVSPLMLACLHNNLSVVQALIQCGADLKLKDKDNHWALWYAQKYGSEQLCIAIKSVMIYNEYEAINIMCNSSNTTKTLWNKKFLRLHGMIDDFGWNLFHWAVSRNLSEFVHIAQNLGFNSVLKDRLGRSPLHLACKFGASLDIVSHFFDDILDVVNETDWSGVTPLMAACRIASVEVVKALLQVGARVYLVDLKDRNALWYAKYYNRMDLYVTLLQAGAQDTIAVNLQFSPFKIFPIQETVNFYDSDGLTPLMRACKDSKIENIESLINNGADLEMLDGDSHSALWHAYNADRDDVCKLLIKSGANPSLKYPNILHSSQNGNIQDLEVALSKKNGFKDIDSWGNNALHWAAIKNDLASMRLLLQAGIDTRATNKLGATPLYMSCVCNAQLQCIKELINYDKDCVNICTNTLKSPLMAACRHSCLEVVKILIKAGAFVNCEDSDERTPLFYAYMSWDWEIYEYLLLCGANPVKGDICLLPCYIDYHLGHWNENKDLAIRLLEINLRDLKLSGDVYLILNEDTGFTEDRALTAIQGLVESLISLDQVIHFVGQEVQGLSWPDVLTFRVSCVPSNVISWICSQSAAIDPDFMKDQSGNDVSDLKSLSRTALRKALSWNARCEKDFCIALDELQVPKTLQNFMRYL